MASFFKPGVSNIAGIVGNAQQAAGRSFGGGLPGAPALRSVASLKQQLGMTDVFNNPQVGMQAVQRRGALPASIASSRYVNQNAGASDLGRIMAALETINDRLAYLESGRVVPQGGGVTSGSRLNNIAALASPPRVGKGGVLSLTPATLAAGAVAGTTATAVLSENVRAKITDTVLELASVSATGDLNDTDELKKITMTVTVNSDPIPTLFDVPCDLLSATLDGPQLAIVKRYIGSDSVIAATFTVNEQLTTAANSTITLRMWSGDGETFTGPGNITY